MSRWLLGIGVFCLGLLPLQEAVVIPLSGPLRVNGWGTLAPSHPTYPHGVNFAGASGPYQVGALTGCDFVDFSVPMTLGSNGQGPFKMIVDTGSSTMAVASSLCDATCAGVSPLYFPNTSSTAVPRANGFVTQAYLGGTGWAGFAYQDLISVGTSGGFNTTFIAMNQTNSFFSTETCQLGTQNPSANTNQGIAGLGFPAYDAGGNPAYHSFMDSMVASTHITDEF